MDSQLAATRDRPLALPQYKLFQVNYSYRGDRHRELLGALSERDAKEYLERQFSSELSSLAIEGIFLIKSVKTTRKDYLGVSLDQ